MAKVMNDKTRKYIKTLLTFDYATLARMYSEWSEETYCAGWMMDAEPEFVEALLNDPLLDEDLHLMEQYEIEGVDLIRKLLREALEKDRDD